MKTFDEIYKELQNTDNKELKEQWKKAKEESKKIKKIALIMCLIIDIIIAIMFFKSNINLGLPFLLPMLIMVFIINIFVFVITNVFFSKNRSEYNLKYKKTVITKIMNNFYDNLEYFPQKPMPEYIYKKIKYESYDHYRSEDYFEAQINKKYGIQMAEVLTIEEETYEDSDGNTETREITKFHGLFAKIEMDKSINSELRIVQNGGMLMPKDRLNMDSSQFEKYFDVKASNKIIGMQLLTADVMEKLIEFKNKTNMEYDISINNNNLYLRFHCGNMFEAENFKKDILEKSVIEKYFYMLNFTYNLSNTLINIINDTQI